jgi:hypothetical protein
MKDFQPKPEASERARPAIDLAVVPDIASRRIMRKGASDPPLRCVSSGYLANGCSCRATIPTGVVTDAWAREQRAGVRGDRFFHFTWRTEVWLAYGLRNGRIRGVYCPEHSAEREQRSLEAAPGANAPAEKVALTG